jgi:3-isopropylmalate dehydrogenase
MFGDILTDEAAGLVGGLGMAPGLNVGPQYAMAQATHGSAPDIAGKHIANPYAMIMSGQMLLLWLGKKKQDRDAVHAAINIRKGVEAVISRLETVTPDMNGSATTEDMGEAICRAIESI